MLLQPFIENAIWHGLRYKTEKGHLWITLTQQTDCVEIEISDNGIGRNASKEMKTANQKKMKSTGIINIENRLELIQNVFKAKLEIDIQDLDIENETGTKVNVKLH
jgi:sensor histidine kinase YesM